MAALCVGLVTAAVACGGPDGGEAPVAAPEFTLDALDGPPVSLASLRGGPVVIDFWATWCAPCVHQIPVLNALQQAHPDVAVLGVSVDTEGDRVVREFAQEQGIEYRILMGDTGLARRFGALGFPALFVLDGEGRVRMSHVGITSERDIVEALDEIAAEAEAAPPSGA